MANVLGKLLVSLGLDAAEFTSGMTKADYRAQQFARTLDGKIAAGIIKAEVAIRAFGAAVRIAGDAFQTLTTGAAAFQDLAETTGAAAADIAGLSVAAATAGVSIEEIGGSINKLTKALVGVDDESKAAGAALKAIGLEVGEFKKLDPVAQYEAIGKALEGYADGAGKVAVAQALLGKSGAEQLKVFKALEEQGGRTSILTQRQIELADQYADRQAKATAEIRLYAQAAATEALPALTELTKAASLYIKELIGVDAKTGQLKANTAIADFAKSGVDALVTLGDGLILFSRLFVGTGKTIAATAATTKAFLFDKPGDIIRNIKAIGDAYSTEIIGLANAPTIGYQLKKLREQSGGSSSIGSENDPRRGRGFVGLPSIDFEGKETAPKKAKVAVVTEAERYLESLQNQLQATKDLSVAEAVLADIQSGRLGVVEPAQQKIMLGVAMQIDAAKRMEDQLKAEKQQVIDLAAEHRKYADAGRQSFEATRTPAEKLSIELDRQLRILKELGVSYQDTYARATQGAYAAYQEATKLPKVLEKTDNIAQELGMSFSSAFEDALISGKSFRDLLGAIEQDIIRIVTRKLVTEPLANYLTGMIGGTSSGGGSSSGGWIGSLIGLFGGLFGGGSGVALGASNGAGGIIDGRAGGGSVGAFGAFRVAENRPEMLDVNGQKILLMGNQRGRIDPNPKFGGGRTLTVVNNFSVPGQPNRRTQSQIAAEASRAISVANARYN